MAPASDISCDATLIALRLSALGDVAIALPALYALCRRQPGLRVVLVTRRPFGALAVDAPANLTVVEADLKGADRGPAGVVRLMRRLIREYRPAAVADLHDVLRTKLMRLAARMAGVRVAVIDKGRRDKKRLTRRGAAATEPLRSSADRYADTLRRLGFDPGSDIAPRIVASADTLPGDVKIGIAPFAAHAGKIFPVGRMEEVVSRLVDSRLADSRFVDRGARVWLFGGGGDEKATLDRWASRWPDKVVSVPSLTPRAGLGGELRLMAGLDVMVAMDSGNMHMASLAGVPVVSVWGATHSHAGFAAPTARPELRAEADPAALPCRPCSVYGNKPCRLTADPTAVAPCMDAVTADMIIERIRLALSQPHN